MSKKPKAKPAAAPVATAAPAATAGNATTELVQVPPNIVVTGGLKSYNPITESAESLASSNVLVAMHVEQLMEQLRSSMLAHRATAKEADAKSREAVARLTTALNVFKETGEGRRVASELEVKLKTWIESGFPSDKKRKFINDVKFITVESSALQHIRVEVELRLNNGGRDIASGFMSEDVPVPADMSEADTAYRAAIELRSRESKLADQLNNLINKPDDLRRTAEADLGRHALVNGGERGNAAFEALTLAANSKAAAMEARLAKQQ